MTISDIFKLNKSQPELDFVNIDVNRDTPLFLDPFFLSIRTDFWSLEATRTIKNYFQTVIDLIKQGKLNEAKRLFVHLHEPNSTCLGVSKGEPQGRGVGSGNTDDIFDSIINSEAIKTGLVEDLEDNILFVDGFGKDKLSDMTTNIIRKHLIDYTISQCDLHKIPLQEDMPTGFFWNRNTVRWDQETSKALIIGERRILLVPKGVVSYSKEYVHTKYYQHFVLNFMQNEHLNMNSALVQTQNNGTRFVTKKDLKERYPNSKEFLIEFTQKNPQVLADFKSRTKISSLTNDEITDSDIKEIIKHLISKLQNTKPGNNQASEYHKLIKGILEVIFYPYLINPSLEKEIHDGRKRIDIVFDNGSEGGIFDWIANRLNLPCPYIFVECKNYSGDPSNPELDQLAGRFSPNRGKVGILMCRTLQQKHLFIKRCSDTYKDQRGLIIPLDDSDVICLLENYDNWEKKYLDEFLAERIKTITLN